VKSNLAHLDRHRATLLLDLTNNHTARSHNLERYVVYEQSIPK
jgi:hypothetical protein